jgi:long-chain acyl-CoA synthetase
MANPEFRTLNELFLKAIERHPKPDAFLFKSGGKYCGLSSKQALEATAGLAAALDRRGIRRGDRVAILSENRVEWALTDYAVLGLGAILVPIYPTLLEPDVEFILSDSGAKAVVCSTSDQLKKVLIVRAELPELNLILIMDGAARYAGAECWQDLVDAALISAPDSEKFFRSRALEIRPEDTASILYTSGTTGQPKGVILTHSNIVSNILACQGLFSFASSEVAISFLPLCHIFERMLDFYYFWAGVTIAYAESLEALPHNLIELRPTVMGVVPRVLEKTYARVMEVVQRSPSLRRKLFAWAVSVGKRHFPYALEHRAPPLPLRLKHALADALVCSKVRARLGGRMTMLISGAAPLSRELAEFFFAMGLGVFEGYGLTETSPVIAVNFPDSVKLGTVGRVIPGVEVRLDEGVATEDDEAGGRGGEILVRGPNVTPGYYHLDEENRQAFTDGWFRTGDLGSIDPDGFLTITGRKKHLFKTSGGKYVPPEKLENLFQGHPYISQIVVLGDGRKFISALIAPNFELLEVYALTQGIGFESRQELVQKPRINAFMQQQVDELTAKLPPHERIRQIALVPREFSIQFGELSATQKIKRRVAEQHFQSLIDEMYARHAPSAVASG